MNKNTGKADRLGRIILGLSLIVAAIIFNIPLLYIGIVPLITGIIGICPAYSIFGINTCKFEFDKENN